MPDIIKNFIQSNWTAFGGGTVVLVWVLGKFAESSWYQTVRKAYGKSLFHAGATVSSIGETKLGKQLWNPIERIGTDFGIFGAEQFGAGLRSDNIEKLEEQLDRLDDVGSTYRADAVAAKIDVIKSVEKVANLGA